MKYRNSKIWQRIVALLLTVILVSTSTSVLEVFAEMDKEPQNKKENITQPTGEAVPAGASGNSVGGSNGVKATELGDMSGYINSRAYLLTLVKVPNTAGLTSGFEAALKADNTLTQVAYSTADQYLSTYPECFSAADIKTIGITDYALVVTKDNNDVTSEPPSSTIHYASMDKSYTDASFSHVYVHTSDSLGNVNSSWKPTDLTRTAILGNTERMTAFLRGEMTLAEAKSCITGDMSAAIKNVIKPLADSGNLTAAMNGDWTKEEVNGTSMYKFYLLDYLLAINNMCGDAYDELIEYYLQTLNCDGADSFGVPMIAACMVYRINKSTYLCSTLPDMLGIVYSGTAVSVDGDVNGNHVSAEGGSSNNSTASIQTQWSNRLMGDKNCVPHRY